MSQRAANPTTCLTISRCGGHVHRRIFDGFSAKLATIPCQIRNPAVIRLDSWRDVTDTSGNTPAASLLELVPCHFSDVHKRRVSLCTCGRFGGNFRLNTQGSTVAPPLSINCDTHPHPERLLLLLPESGGIA